MRKECSARQEIDGSGASSVPGLTAGQLFPAIPRTDNDLTPPDHIQAIANTAGFHFATIEQGGSSLYPTMALKVTNPVVLRILLSNLNMSMSPLGIWPCARS